MQNDHAALNPDDSVFALTPFEQFWRDHYMFLQSRGYTLRPRYHPDWQPSWKQTGALFYTAEDYVQLPVRPGVIDATRTSDGRLVYLKKVASTSNELEILKCLSSDELREDPCNHSVPLLDAFQPPDNLGITFLVMPFLRSIDDPPFETVEDALDCGEQLLEGLLFLHNHHIAHRDCAYRNVMMDAAGLYPKGFHPVQTENLPDISGPAPVLPRSTIPIGYYFLDFGISTHFPAGTSEKLVAGRDGLERTVPELSDDVPYDPFKLDTYILGALFKQEMLAKYSNLDSVASLVARMTNKDPALRPSAFEALQEWRSIRATLPSQHRFWRVKPYDETFMGSALRDALSFISSVRGGSRDRGHKKLSIW
ncbi:kinase-like domain-containing protein [Trametes maxima]|nr:kinase-like domain-containing protein [Trametes maxima]